MNKIGSYHFIILLLFLVCLYAQDQPKLIYVQEVFRHGARYPIQTLGSDKLKFVVTEKLNGELTRQGKSMQYKLGNILYREYWHRLFGNNNSYKQSKFYFRSTDTNRTIESLQCQLMGLFENIEPQTLYKEDLTWSQPNWSDKKDFGEIPNKYGKYSVFERSPLLHSFPIHVQDPKMNVLSMYAPQICPKQNEWIKNNKKNPQALKIMNNQRFKKALSQASKVIGKEITFFDLRQHYDNAICLKHLRKKVLPIFQDDYEMKRQILGIVSTYEYIQLFFTEEQISATTTGFFNDTVNNIKRVVSDQSGIQWAFYSAHDTTVGAFLARLGMAGARCIYQNYLNGTFRNKDSKYCIVQIPSYSSQIIFEVYQYPNKTSTIKIKYNGNYRLIPFCGWQEQCQVERMYSWYNSWKDEDYINTCKGKKESSLTHHYEIFYQQLLKLEKPVTWVESEIHKKKYDGNSVNGASSLRNYQFHLLRVQS